MTRLPARFLLLAFASGIMAVTAGAPGQGTIIRPAPDLPGMVTALITHEATSPHSYMRANRAFTYHLVLPETGGHRAMPLPAGARARLKAAGIAVDPDANCHVKAGTVTGHVMCMTIRRPRLRPDGRYDVSYGYYCGSLCASWHVAIMFHDAQGWHVLSTRMTAIS